MNNLINIPEYEVSQFNNAFKDLINENFNYVRIKGEISEIRTATKGQIYLTLKDNESILSAVIWDQKKKFLNFNPEIGMEVVVTGKITTWSRFKTTYQVDIDNVELAGEGALLKLIEERKKKLKAKGYFDDENKKLIPFLPDKIGVITSPTGSVIHDIINRIKDRFPLPIDIWPVSVQGSEAPISIINAIKGFNKMKNNNQPSLIIIARGGGSTEDLMAFNDERLAIEVFNSKIPIISAIGHETDTTIIDFVSDLRAATPTAAAEKSVPLRKELLQNLKNFRNRLDFFINNEVKTKISYTKNLIKFLRSPNDILKTFENNLFQNLSKIESLTQNIYKNNYLYVKNFNRTLKYPENFLKLKKSQINTIDKNINQNLKNNISNNNKNFEKLSRLLYSNSISSNLKKGYSIVSNNKKIIKTKKELKKNNNIKVQLYDGTINLKVKETN